MLKSRMDQSQKIVSNVSIVEEYKPVNTTKRDVEGEFPVKGPRLEKDSLENLIAPVEPRNRRHYTIIPGLRVIESGNMMNKKNSKGVTKDLLGYVKIAIWWPHLP